MADQRLFLVFDSEGRDRHYGADTVVRKPSPGSWREVAPFGDLVDFWEQGHQKATADSVLQAPTTTDWRDADDEGELIPNAFVLVGDQRLSVRTLVEIGSGPKTVTTLGRLVAFWNRPREGVVSSSAKAEILKLLRDIAVWEEPTDAADRLALLAQQVELVKILAAIESGGEAP